MKKIKLSGPAFIILAAVFWGMQGLFSKMNTWGTLSLIAVRSMFSTLALGILRRDFRPKFTKGNIIAAVSVCITASTFIAATKLTTAANAVILQYTMTVYILLFEWLFLKKRPKGLDIGAFLLLILGIILCMAGNMGKGRLSGDILGLVSALSFSVVYLAKRMEGTSAVHYSYMGCALMMIFTVAIPFDPLFDFQPVNIISAAGMGLCVGIGYYCFGRGLDSGMKAVHAAVLSYIEPVLNPLLVLLVVGEKPTWVSFLGFFVVLVTVIIYNVLEGGKE